MAIVAETQRATVLRFLSERGEQGISAFELIYQHGITRAAAIVHTLRHRDGLNIVDIQDRANKTSIYVLRPGPFRPHGPTSRVQKLAAVVPKAPPEPEPIAGEAPNGAEAWKELGERWARK